MSLFVPFAGAIFNIDEINHIKGNGTSSPTKILVSFETIDSSYFGKECDDVLQQLDHLSLIMPGFVRLGFFLVRQCTVRAVYIKTVQITDNTDIFEIIVWRKQTNETLVESVVFSTYEKQKAEQEMAGIEKRLANRY